jgi:hypothetical protein
MEEQKKYGTWLRTVPKDKTASNKTES